MFIVGIIGPYISGGNRRLIDHNIANARYVGICIANHFRESKLVGVFIPHTHTAEWEKLAEAPEAYYHALDDAIYDGACVGFVLLPDWKNSSGARRDQERAEQAKKKVFELLSWQEQDIRILLFQIAEWAKNLQNRI